MSKLSLDALKERAEAVASEDLLNSISGGIANACHVQRPSTLDMIRGFIVWAMN